MDKKNNLKRVLKYLIVGLIITIFNFTLYIILSNLINNENLLWLSSLIANIFAIFLAYFLHSKITWQKSLEKTSLIKFFIWNIIVFVILSPLLVQLFSLCTPLYEAVFNLLSPNFDITFNFIQNTLAFCIVTAITMTLNFLFYDKFVFKTPKK